MIGHGVRVSWFGPTRVSIMQDGRLGSGANYRDVSKVAHTTMEVAIVLEDGLELEFHHARLALLHHLDVCLARHLLGAESLPLRV